MRTKRRLALIYSGGVLAHLCIIGIVLIARRGNIPLFPPNHIDIPWSVSASNAYALIMALLPFSRRIGGSRVSSDGLRLIMLPFMNRERIAELKKSTDFVSVIENLLDGEIESARQELERLLKLYPDNPQGRLMLIRIYIQRLKFDEALFNLRRLLEHDKKANNDPVILNLMSWDLLLDDRRKNLAEAEQYALRAYRLRAFPKTTNTVALIRMLKGESEQAEELLEAVSNLKRKASRETNHPISFFFRSILAKRRGDPYEVMIKRLIDNMSMLTVDELFLANELNCETEVIARCVEYETAPDKARHSGG